MNNDTETLVVLAMDHILTSLDRITDMTVNLDTPTRDRIENLVMDATMQIDSLIDRIAADRYDSGNTSGAI